MHGVIGGAAALMLALLALPVTALIVRALGALEAHLLAGQALGGAIRSAVALSLLTTLVSMAWVILLGLPLAYAFARYRFPFKRALNVLVELPIVMPPVVAGLALLMAFGRRGLLGPALETVGITLPFTPAAIILAQVFVSAPFFIRAAQARFEAIPRELEEAARIDGAGEWRVLWSIIIPLSLRGLSSGLILSWARALGEFGATMLFAGNLPGRTQTMPLLVYGALERDLDAALWAGLLLLLIAAAALAAAHLLVRRINGKDEKDPLAEGGSQP